MAASVGGSGPTTRSGSSSPAAASIVGSLLSLMGHVVSFVLGMSCRLSGGDTMSLKRLRGDVIMFYDFGEACEMGFDTCHFMRR